MGKIVSGITQGLGLTADPNTGAAAMQQSMDMQRQALEELKKVAPSDYAKLEELAKKAAVVMPDFVGELQAEELDAEDLLSVFSSPAFQKMAESEAGIEAELDKIIDQGGMTEEMKSDYQQFQDQAAAQAKAEQESITQQEMQQGRSGSGVKVMQQIAANQASAQRRAQAAQKMAGDAQKGRMDALQNKTTLAGQQGQRGIQETSARQNVEQFNALQRTGVNQANLARRQQLSDLEAAQQRQMYGQLAGIEGQKFGESMQRAGGVASGMQNYGNALAQQAGMQAQSAQAQAAGNMALVGAGISAFGGKADGGVKYADGGFHRKFNDGSEDLYKNPLLREALLDARASQNIARGESASNPMNNPTYRRRLTTEDSFNKAYSGSMLASGLNKIRGLLSSDDKKEFKPSEAGYSAEYEASKKLENKGKSPDELRKQLQEAKSGSSAVGAFGDALRSMGQKGMQQDMMPQRQAINLQQRIQSFNPLQGMVAADGGVRRPEDVMADIQNLIQQEFAQGGVKYKDGGFDPSDERLRTISENRNSLLRQIEENKELGNLRANGALQEQLKSIEAEMIRNAERGLQYENGGISPELREASQMFRQQAAPGAPMPGGQPPMSPAPMSQDMPMAPQGVPMMPPQQPPMPPQGQMMADGGMAYEDGGEGTIIDSGMEMYAGDQLPDRINDGEMVLNVEQQDRLNDALMELKRLKSKERTDKMLADGEAEINPMQQEAIMAFVRGEIDVDELPSERVVKEPSIGEPSGNMAKLLCMVSRKKRR